MTQRLLVLVVALAICTTVAAQTRPDFSGQWQVVAERSTPSDRFAFGKEFRISQTRDTFSLELPRSRWTRGEDGKTVTSDAGLGEPLRYYLDGEQHDNLRRPFSSTPEGHTLFESGMGGRYRATWIPNALVLVTLAEIPYMSVSAANPTIEWVRHEYRYSFALGPDGTLVGESEITSEPRTNNPKPKPIYLRSVYKRVGK